jgi:hypothetical protein
MLFDINQSGKFGTHFFIQFSDLFGQCVGLLSVFLLNSLDELLTQIVDFAIGLGLSLVATNDNWGSQRRRQNTDQLSELTGIGPEWRQHAAIRSRTHSSDAERS